ncbi:hypothetical protein LY78DRAFT_494285 [Colletotrichum sublineola]|nr:hypothetical protein LY78DRAFT_494285 [Colletotrichum sublineola]
MRRILGRQHAKDMLVHSRPVSHNRISHNATPQSTIRPQTPCPVPPFARPAAQEHHTAGPHRPPECNLSPPQPPDPGAEGLGDESRGVPHRQRELEGVLEAHDVAGNTRTRDSAAEDKGRQNSRAAKRNNTRGGGEEGGRGRKKKRKRGQKKKWETSLLPTHRLALLEMSPRRRDWPQNSPRGCADNFFFSFFLSLPRAFPDVLCLVRRTRLSVKHASLSA